MISLFNNKDIELLDNHAYTLNDVLTGLGYDLGLADYPIFDEKYRETLNNRIIDHFRYRRIAAETPAMFIFYLNRRLSERMPTYNAIYKAVLGEHFDPLVIGGTTTHTAGTDTGETISSGSANSQNTTSSTPATYLDDPAGKQYMDGLTAGKSETSGQDNNKSTTDHTTTTLDTGNWLDTLDSIIMTRLLEVDALVCDMLEPCFIQVWDDLPSY